MASLLNKLRQAQPLKKQQPQKPAAESCFEKITSFPIEGIQATDLTKETLALIEGKEYPDRVSPEELLFLDTETTGLKGGAGTLAFLIGLGKIEQGQFVVRQYLMRDYDEEPFVLDHFLKALNTSRMLITYNGASFDVPLLESRLVMNRMRREAEIPPHLDLIHAARRVYKLRLQRCSLSQVEEQVFLEPRQDDLPGSQVPQRYFTYLKTKEMALLDDILRHNALDILSMLRLLYTLYELHEEPMKAADQRDLFSLGRVFEKRGEGEKAGQCFKAVDEKGIRDLAQLRLADMMRRKGEHGAAVEHYEALRLRGAGGAKVYIALSKLYEHRFREPARALAIARQGMVYCLERLGGEGADSPEYRDLQHRARRLIIKTGGKADGLFR